MKPSDEFFSRNRYAIFGAKARGRAQGPVLIGALRKAGKSVVAIESDGSEVKGAEVHRSLSDAGHVDGVVLLPPAPWDQSASEFTTDAVRQCKALGVTELWIYTAGDHAPAVGIAEKEGIDPSAGVCPCLHISGGGFPHNLHRFIQNLVQR